MSGVRWAIVAAAVAKGFDAWQLNHGLGAIWFVGAAAMGADVRSGGVVLALIAFGGAWLSFRRFSNHVVFIGWVSTILALWDDRPTRTRLLRIQLCAVYFFGAVSKINPAFLSGQTIANRQTWVPFPQACAFAAIAAELALCAGVWYRWHSTLAFAIAFHVALTVGWTVDFFGDGPGILVFNALMVVVVAAIVPRRPVAAANSEETRSAHITVRRP